MRYINLYKKFNIMTTCSINDAVHAIAHDINSSAPTTFLTPPLSPDRVHTVGRGDGPGLGQHARREGN